MINYSKRIKNQEYITNSDSSSQINFHFPIKNQKPNNISFKNSIYLMKSEQKANTHRQYLIDFIRDNNNKNKKQKNEKINPTKKNSNTLTKKEEQNEKNNQEILDPKNFFNDYFNYQSKQERLKQNKSHQNEFIMDIIDYLGEEAFYPININIMNVKMRNFIPGKISTKSFGLINSYAANTNQGIDRNYNDDRVKIIINMNKPSNYINSAPWPLMSYFGIFDGHNGDHCAEFLRKNLLQYIYTNPNFPNDVEKAIKEGFINADQYYIKNLSEINSDNTINNHEICNNSGSCGLILLIIDTKIYVANVGDSRCVVSCQNGKIQKDVTRDHKPEFPYEKERIYYHGGKIYRNETIFTEEIKNYKSNKTKINKTLLGPYRVDPGKLSVSRTIGDAKAKLEKFGGVPMVIVPEPDIYVFDFFKDDIDYFIMGCDGIFDRIKSYEIFKCVDTIVNKEKELVNKNTKFNNCFNTCYDRKINMNATCGNIVDIILRLSMLRKSYDNVTCIIVAFKDLIFGKNSNQKTNDKQFNNLMQFYDKNNFKSLKDKYNNNIIINKDIHIAKSENENRKNTSQENNRHFYKKIDNNSTSNLDLNKFRNNYLYNDREKKNRNDKNENNKENEIINQNNNKKLQSQSQEKKIRELITLFSINNKKRSDNDNTSFLYNTYNSKNKDKEINHDFNNTQRTVYKNNILFNSSNLGENISNKNISLVENNKEKYESKNKSSTISVGQITPNKYNKINNLQRLDFKKYKPSYFNLKNYPKKISNLKMNSYNIEEEDNDLDTKEEKPYAINNQTNRIKSNSTEHLYATPNKSQVFTNNNRITSRKIIRKTNNFFMNKTNLKEGLNNESNSNDKNKQSINNNKNNFFHSVVLSANKKESNYRYKNKNDSQYLEPSNTNNINSLVNIRKINYEKYKVKNPRYKNSKNNESVNDNKFNRYEKMGNTKYEKNSKFLNENLTGSSSVSIIYTKKRKVK